MGSHNRESSIYLLTLNYSVVYAGKSRTLGRGSPEAGSSGEGGQTLGRSKTESPDRGRREARELLAGRKLTQPDVETAERKFRVVRWDHSALNELVRR